VHGAARVSERERLPDDGLIGDEVFFGDNAALFEDVRGSAASQLPLVEEVRSLLSHGVQSVGELGEAYLLALAVRAAIREEVLLRLVG
jgi:hypothetical protein